MASYLTKDELKDFDLDDLHDKIECLKEDRDYYEDKLYKVQQELEEKDIVLEFYRGIPFQELLEFVWHRQKERMCWCEQEDGIHTNLCAKLRNKFRSNPSLKDASCVVSISNEFN